MTAMSSNYNFGCMSVGGDNDVYAVAGIVDFDALEVVEAGRAIGVGS